MDWTNLFQTLGIAVPILMFVGWCVVQLARWAGPRIDRLTERLFVASDKIEAFDARITKLEQQVMAAWEFMLRRAHVEALENKVATMNSPIKIKPEAMEWLGELREELQAFYRRLGRNLTNVELMIALEQQFGEEIVKRVCIPHGLFQGTCLLIAMAVARGDDVIGDIDIEHEEVNDA